MQVDSDLHPTESIEAKPSKPFLKAAKISPDIKRRRRNYRFKKLLAPKNPLMILNELKSGLTFEFSESVASNNQIIFTATVQFEEGKTFSGKGLSKKLAQQAAAEETLKGLFFHKLLEQLPKTDPDSEMHEVDMQTKVKDDSSGLEEEANNQLSGNTSLPAEDDTPWSSLASLAFYKLINQWQTQASTVSSNTASPDSTKSSTGGVRKLPENPTLLDPVMLLHQISPGSKFIETARDVRQGTGEHSCLFTLSVDFNGQQFEGSANRKKDAKKICAKKALATVGVVY